MQGSVIVMKKIISLLFLMLILAGLGPGDAGEFFTEPLSMEKIKLLPVPADFRNYFVLHSIGNDSYVLIGDFTGSDKIFSLIYDQNSDNSIDRVTEYYPDQQKFRVTKESTSQYATTGIDKLKREIITGEIFHRNYAYKMRSLDVLLYQLKRGTDVFQYEHGYTVKFFDPDEPTTIMSEFFFGKKQGRYDLIFKTNYYKIYKMKIIPPIPFSVYCKESRDPVVAEYVEQLLKQVVK